MLVVLVISLPLYVCTTASVPIAASLIAAGMPAGSALVFLMAGPATNVVTIGAVYRTGHQPSSPSAPGAVYRTCWVVGRGCWVLAALARCAYGRRRHTSARRRG
jgi:hypothetical protein